MRIPAAQLREVFELAAQRGGGVGTFPHRAGERSDAIVRCIADHSLYIQGASRILKLSGDGAVGADGTVAQAQIVSSSPFRSACSVAKSSISSWLDAKGISGFRVPAKRDIHIRSAHKR